MRLSSCLDRGGTKVTLARQKRALVVLLRSLQPHALRSPGPTGGVVPIHRLTSPRQ